MKNLLKITVAASALLLAGCGQSPEGDKAVLTDAHEVGKPELGDFGIDLTARLETVKAGDGFFRYASGSWLDSYEIPAEYSSYGAFTVLAERSEDRVKKIIDELAGQEFAAGTPEQMVGDYYKSYMNEALVEEKGVAPLLPLLAQVAAIDSKEALVKAFGHAEFDDTVSPFVFGVDADRLNPDVHQVQLFMGGMGLPDRDYYLEDTERFTAIRAAYVAHITKMLELAGIEGAGDKAAAILALETKIAQLQWPRAERRDSNKTSNPMTMADLAKNYPGIDWAALIAATGYPVENNLNVYYPSTLAPLVALVKEESLDTWKAHMAFHTISNHAAVLPAAFDGENFEFYGKTLRGQQEQRERWKRGVARVGGRASLGMPLGQIYVERYFPAEAKAEMVKLVANLRVALGERIKDLTWMGDATKEKALEKLSTFNPKIGYPDVWEKFDGLEVKPDDLFGNAVRVRHFAIQKDIARLGKPTDRQEWGMTPQTVNAYYNPSFNEIVFPAAILQAPFFDLNADPAVNYGGIGAVIGHEIGHGFDDQGSKYDAKGFLNDWWTAEDRANFEGLVTKLADQYSGFEVLPGSFVDGRFTLGENIGDVGGLSMAYHAYKLSLNGQEAPVIDGLTGDQRFFLSWAQVWKRKSREEALLNQVKSDPHSPAEFRVDGVVRNMDAWYEAFGVEEGTKLYLPKEERIKIW